MIRSFHVSRSDYEKLKKGDVTALHYRYTTAQDTRIISKVVALDKLSAFIEFTF